MGNLNYILTICIMVPLIMMLFLLEKKARLTIAFFLTGIFMCLFVSEVNGLLLRVFSDDMYYVTTTITPITEEIVKALPILFFAFVISDNRRDLITASMAVGIGFAILENMIILIGNIEGTSLLWALSRGFGAGLMHGICTAAVGIGISFVTKKRKLFIVGTFALLVAAIIYHALFNVLVQSDFPYAGIILPVITYIPIIIAVKRRKTKSKPVAL